MLQNRSSTRQFVSAPPSASSYVAAFLEPAISIACFVVIALQHQDEIDRPATVLCLLVFALTYPGTNRFRDRPLYAAVDVCAAWATLLTILGLCAFATDSFALFHPRALILWALVTPVVHWCVAFAGRIRTVDHRGPQQPGKSRQTGFDSVFGNQFTRGTRDQR